MFDATLQTSSLHDHTYLRVGGLLTSFCTCSHVRCYTVHVFFTWSHIPSGGGAVNVLLHLLTCSMLRFRRLLYMITHTFGWGGLLTSFCTCSHVRCYASDVFFTWSHIPSGGGAVNVLLHLLTCSMLRFRRLLHMITHTFGWGGGC